MEALEINKDMLHKLIDSIPIDKDLARKRVGNIRIYNITILNPKLPT